MVTGITVSLDDKVIEGLDAKLSEVGGSRSAYINQLLAKDLGIKLGHSWRLEVDKAIVMHLENAKIPFKKFMVTDTSGIENTTFRLYLPKSKKLICDVNLYKYYVSIDFGVNSIAKKYIEELNRCRMVGKLPVTVFKCYSRRTALLWESDRKQEMSNEETAVFVADLLNRLNQFILLFNTVWNLD